MLGAKPMKLGLDLRGGIHFLLSVDVDSMLKKREAGDARNIANDLREAKIRYAAVQRIPGKGRTDGIPNSGIRIRFRKQDNLEKAYHLLKRRYPEFQLSKTAKNGDYEIIGRMTPEALHKLGQYTVEQTMTVLRNRVNELGVAEPIVQQQGKDKIVVDLPGVQDAAQAQQILGGTATLEFHLVDDRHDVASALRGQVPFGSKVYTMSDGTPILLQNRVVLSGNSIVNSSSGFGEDGRPNVSIRVAGSEVSLFNRITRKNIGHRMAIVYVETKTTTEEVNGKPVTSQRKVERVISAPVIQNALGNNFQITGLASPQEASNLALLLRAGALPVAINIVEESNIGPSLGKENIHKGFVSVQIGFILIVLFMALYYRVFGIIADLALAMNLVLVLALMSIMGFTLTLPGIAGIVLTVGMAVDANVLIFERIREELRSGMTPQASIYAGYEKAFSTIVDANVTTLIVALVLFVLGTGSIKGFAVTLTLGILTSMLTAITGTRAVVNLLYGGKKNPRLNIGIHVDNNKLARVEVI